MSRQRSWRWFFAEVHQPKINIRPTRLSPRWMLIPRANDDTGTLSPGNRPIFSCHAMQPRSSRHGPRPWSLKVLRLMVSLHYKRFTSALAASVINFCSGSENIRRGSFSRRRVHRRSRRQRQIDVSFSPIAGLDRRRTRVIASSLINCKFFDTAEPGFMNFPLRCYRTESRPPWAHYSWDRRQAKRGVEIDRQNDEIVAPASGGDNFINW